MTGKGRGIDIKVRTAQSPGTRFRMETQIKKKTPGGALGPKRGRSVESTDTEKKGSGKATTAA